MFFFPEHSVLSTVVHLPGK